MNSLGETLGNGRAGLHSCGGRKLGGNVKMDGYGELANAIILRAVEDYRQSVRKLKRKKDYRPAIEMKREVEAFFRSEWFSMLTGIDGKALLERIRSEVAA